MELVDLIGLCECICYWDIRNIRSKGRTWQAFRVTHFFRIFFVFLYLPFTYTFEILSTG